MFAAASAFYVTCQTLLQVPGTSSGNCFFMCGLLGMMAALMTVLITQYYTDYAFYPVRSIAEAAKSGHATTIITGSSVGMESTAAPTLLVCFCLLSSYYLGEASGKETNETCDQSIPGYPG